MRPRQIRDAAPQGGVKGTIGLTVTGVAVFGDADADNRDAYVYEGASMDTCMGHANAE